MGIQKRVVILWAPETPENARLQRWLETLCDDLQAVGCSVFLDLSHVNTPHTEIETMISNSHVVLVIGTHHYTALSKNKGSRTEIELEYLLLQVLSRASSLLPLLWAGDPETAFPSWFKDYDIRDHRDGAKYIEYMMLLPILLGISPINATYSTLKAEYYAQTAPKGSIVVVPFKRDKVAYVDMESFDLDTYLSSPQIKLPDPGDYLLRMRQPKRVASPSRDAIFATAAATRLTEIQDQDTCPRAASSPSTRPALPWNKSDYEISGVVQLQAPPIEPERSCTVPKKAWDASAYEIRAATDLDLPASIVDARSTLANKEEERKILEQALLINEKHYGKDHPEVAKTPSRLGATYQFLGHIEEARLCFQRAHALFSTSYGENNPDTREAFLALAMLTAEN